MKPFLFCIAVTISVFSLNFAQGLWLGNDAVYTALFHPLLYRFYLSLGIEPVWYPHVGGGTSIGFFFFAQPYHLPAYLLSLVPGYGEGWIRLLFAAKHVLMLSTLLWMTWTLIKRQGADARLAFLLAMSLIFTLRFLDTVRFVIYLDTVFYFTVFLLACVQCFTERGNARSWYALIAAASSCVVTSGYSAIFPYVFWFSVFYFARLIFATRPSPQRLAALAAAGLVGLLLSGPALLMTRDFVTSSLDRVANRDLAWSDYFPLSLPLLAENLFRPWRADVTSGFGGTALLSVLALASWRLPLKDPSFRRLRPFLFFAAGLFLFSFGAHTPFFRLFFEIAPGVSAVRGPARALALLVPLLLAELWLLDRRGERLAARLDENQRSWFVRVSKAVMALSALYGLVWLAKARIYDTEYYEWTPDTITGWWPWKGLLWLGLTFIALTCFIRYLRTSRSRDLTITSVATFAQALLIMNYGSWREPMKTAETYDRFARAEHLPLATDLTYSIPLLDKGNSGVALQGMHSYRESFGRLSACLIPFEKTEGNPAGFPLGFYLMESGAKTAPPPGIGDLQTCEQLWAALGLRKDHLRALNAANRLTCLTPNQICLDYESPESAVLQTGFPWRDKGWTVLVDGRAGTIRNIYSGLLGVDLPPGRHHVVVRAEAPWMPAAGPLACAGLLGLFLLAAYDLRIRNRSYRMTALLAAGCALSIALTWTRSRQAERNRFTEILLTTRYTDLLHNAFGDVPDRN